MHTSAVLPADADSGVADFHHLMSTKNRQNYFCRQFFRPLDECSSDYFRKGIADSPVLVENASTPLDYGLIVVEEFHSVPTIL